MMYRRFRFTILLSVHVSMAGAAAFAEIGTSIGTSTGTAPPKPAAGPAANSEPANRSGCANRTAGTNSPITGPGSAPNQNLIPSMPYGVGTTYQSQQYPGTIGNGTGC